MELFENHTLGIEEDDIAISTSDEHKMAAIRMAQQIRRSVVIISRELDPLVYNLPEFVEAIKRSLLNNRRATVRVIVFEPQTIVRRGHLLLDLAANLPSFIEFRKAGKGYDNFNESLYIADETGYVYRTSAERFDGIINFNDKRKSKVLMDVFEEMWGRATPDSNLRKLSL